MILSSGIWLKMQTCKYSIHFRRLHNFPTVHENEGQFLIYLLLVKICELIKTTRSAWQIHRTFAFGPSATYLGPRIPKDYYSAYKHCISLECYICDVFSLYWAKPQVRKQQCPPSCQAKLCLTTVSLTGSSMLWLACLAIHLATMCQDCVVLWTVDTAGGSVALYNRPVSSIGHPAVRTRNITLRGSRKFEASHFHPLFTNTVYMLCSSEVCLYWIHRLPTSTLSPHLCPVMNENCYLTYCVFIWEWKTKYLVHGNRKFGLIQP